ncbi:hypothetical protein CDD82_246 [Ophiocordyceps australis]|uniref:Uncharacterized protein n=1 Tax=Ophiocordyceps australis TaxID=1399860 RepID=A0A2C5ZKS6_9HYPO|nr:hypothetical protein CDD82_246 [Ophiocordyceps australis]
MSLKRSTAASRGHMQVRGGSFEVLEDEFCDLIDLVESPRVKVEAQSLLSGQAAFGRSARDVLDELRTDHRLNHEIAAVEEWSTNGTSCPVEKAHQQSAAFFNEAKSAKAKSGWRCGRRLRPVIETETFEPLDAVLEESILGEAEASSWPKTGVDEGVEESEPQAHVLTGVDWDCHVEEQIEKHLAGQFEWILTQDESSSARDEGSAASGPDGIVYGCNFLRRSGRGGTDVDSKAKASQANVYYAFLATPLKTKMNDGSQGAVSMAHVEPRPRYPGSPVKVPEVVKLIEKALSPAVSCASSDCSWSQAGSLSVPRIDVSLEELDQVDDDIEEAIGIATLSQEFARLAIDSTGRGKLAPNTPKEENRASSSKTRPTLAQSATVRVKASEKARPTIRRSSSMTFGEEKAASGQAGEDKRLTTRKAGVLTRTTPKSGSKSSKPPTVPRFELPGEAVSRRLKEQRDARKAQQAEAQRTPVASASKAKSSRGAVTKASFELPGEAISRRKREEREAKLQAQEEAERQRREFKARPMRQVGATSIQPRETAASRARAKRLSHDQGCPPADEAKRPAAGSLSRRAGANASVAVREGNATGAGGARGRGL